MTLVHYLIYFLIAAGAVISIITDKLTVPAALLGFLTGSMVFAGGGYSCLSMLIFFFFAGTWATGWQAKQKQQMGLAQEAKGRRTAGQVFANGGMAAILCCISFFKPQFAAVLQLMAAGSIAAATADTLSSELGTVLGKRFYNILSFKRDKRGLDGVVSLEGSLAGLAGSVIIGLIYITGHHDGVRVLWIAVAGMTGNLADSVLGATLERKGVIGNNTVNFLNTAIGAFTCLLLS
ncbi:MAG TPA: DUF92 domain-containing protein [Mucilaginibacter sp.]|nr:DUF92 domain-containing protein [Mucilaginibacter sp.]